MFDHLRDRLPRPELMDPKAYERNVKARAYDVARYLLFFGVPTSVRQVTSIRTLEKQIRRIKASEYGELQELGEELAQSCAAEPDCPWDKSAAGEPVAPTLTRHVEADQHLTCSRNNLRLWALQNLPPPAGIEVEGVDLLRPTDTLTDIVATLLYPVTERPYRELYEIAAAMSGAQRKEILVRHSVPEPAVTNFCAHSATYRMFTTL